jgi:hypothetical protein
MTFTVKGRQYRYDTTTGHIEQIDAKPYKYDDAYSAIYDTPAYVRGNETLQAIRLGFVCGIFGGEPDSILDMGYGNGAFLRQTVKAGIKSYGFDITGVAVPEGATFAAYEDEKSGKLVPSFGLGQVVTFWDCFEHIPAETLDYWLFLMKGTAMRICISLPNCDVESKGLNWFEHEYFHLKPDEHLRHFSAKSLGNFMGKHGFDTVYEGYHEDVVRSRGKRNILTMAFR